MERKTRIMLHIIMPSQISGPNVASKKIGNSYLSKKYEFGYLTQNYHAGGKVNVRLIKDLIKQIKKFNPDIIHLSGMQASGFHAVVAARLAGHKNIIITIRGLSSDVVGMSWIKRKIYSLFEDITLKLVDQFNTVCKAATDKKIVRRNIKKFACVIHNAAPNIDSLVYSSRDTIRKYFSADDTDKLIVITGRMVYDKGITYISEAIDRLDLSSKKFIFIGDGEYCEILQQVHKDKIKDKKVFILGKRNDVVNILFGCDIYLFATLHENLSNALLEACAVGLPVVATKVGGNTEVIQEGINGFLIEPCNSKLIQEKIEFLCNSENLLRKFSANTKGIIRTKFSENIIHSQIDVMYKKYLK